MADALSVLAWGLRGATGLQVYPAPKPEGVTLPCLTYQVISDPMQDHNHSAGASIHMTRVQINHIGNYEDVRPYVQTVQNFLEGNKTDFLSAISDGIYREVWEGEDIWSLIRGYFIQWKA
jgi:hypothetical protein